MHRKSLIGFLALALCVARVSPQFATDPGNHTILEGQDVVIECIIEGLEESDMVIWQGNQSGESAVIALNGKVGGTKAERYSVTGEKSRGEQHLFIQNAKVSDEGTFRCEVFGASLSQEHRLIVNIPASVTVDPPGFKAVNLGDQIILSCDARGKPSPTVTWLKTGGNLPDGRPNFVGKTLEIMQAEVDDAGEYFCQADNGVQSPATAFVQILVQYAPNVKVSETLIYTEVGPSARLSMVCEFDGVPTVDVYWRHDQNRVNLKQRTTLSSSHAEGRHILQISGVTPEDLGEYECVGGNDKGIATGKITIKAEPHGLEISSETDGIYSDQYSLDWAVNSHNQLIEFDLKLLEVNDTHNTTWEANVVPAPRHHDFHHKQHYVIKALKASTVYKVQLRARNSVGYSQWVDFEFNTNEAGNTAPAIPPSTPRPQPDPHQDHSINTNDSVSYTIVIPEESQDGSNINGASCVSLMFIQLVIMATSALLLL